MTARDRLARAIGLHHPLSEADREDIIDAGLANEYDFEPGDDPFASDDDPPNYAYRGSRWGVEYTNGRPRLVEAINVPLPSAVAQTEHAFALVVDMLEVMLDSPTTDEKIADLREDGWAETFRHAAERDGEGSGAQGTDINDGVGRNHASDETDDDAGEKGERK